MNEQQIQQEHSSAKTLGIVALICGFVCWPAGIICGHIVFSVLFFALIDGIESIPTE